MTTLAALTPIRIANFWASVALPEDQSACWHWTGDRSRRGGYGRFNMDGLDFAAHRVALTLKLGRDIAPGLQAQHLCDNVACCNPAHLVEGSLRSNKIHKTVGARHAHGERHGNAKLSASDVGAIVARLAVGETHDDIAREFGIARATLTDIAMGRTWRAVTGFERKRFRAVPLAISTLREIVHAHFHGATIAALAKAHGIARNVVREIARGEALPRPRTEAKP